jgi:hypothetical protein
MSVYMIQLFYFTLGFVYWKILRMKCIVFHSIQFYSNSTAASVTPFSCLLQPVLAVGKQLGITSLSLISSCSHSIKKFRQTATDLGVLVGRVLHVAKHSKIIGDIVKKLLEESVSGIKSNCIF